MGIVAEPGLAAIFEPLFGSTVLSGLGAGAVIAFGIINLVHLTHGEQTLPYLGVERSRLVCRYGATPLYWFNRLILPVIRLGDQAAKWTLRLFTIEMTGPWLEAGEEDIETRAELRARLVSVLSEGDLSPERREEVMNALQIGNQTVREVMVDDADIVALSTTAGSAENFRRMAEHPHTRYPLVGEALSEFVGIVYVPVLTQHRESLQRKRWISRNWRRRR